MHLNVQNVKLINTAIEKEQLALIALKGTFHPMLVFLVHLLVIPAPLAQKKAVMARAALIVKFAQIKDVQPAIKDTTIILEFVKNVQSIVLNAQDIINVQPVMKDTTIILEFVKNAAQKNAKFARMQILAPAVYQDIMLQTENVFPAL